MSTALAVNSGQAFWDERQLAALRQIGLVDAPKPDLAVFLHFCQRTGLDPFARQIYMIGRGGKYNIQASIDGLRIVAQRSGNYGGQTMTEWCGEDGIWHDVWLPKTPPVAARVGIYYKDSSNPTWASAKFDSYNTNSPIWKKMPDLMIAKCAEALALRKAFPNDLSGIYSDDEMEQADKPKIMNVKSEPIVLKTVEIAEPVAPLTNDEIGLVVDEILACVTSPELAIVWNKNEKHLDEIFNADGEKVSLRDLIMLTKDNLDVTNVLA